LGLSCWEILVNEKTGQKINDIRSTNIRGLDMKLKPSIYGGYTLLGNGSFHKFHNCGEQNADQFTFAKLSQSIDSFADIFGVDSEKCFIHGLEIGVNIPLPYSPLRVFKNLVCYRSRAFTQINKKNARNGLQCALTQYRVKVYDKEKQSGLKCGHLLRFEISIDKMQILSKYGISTLADLHNPKKLYPLVDLLKEALQGIIWTDTGLNLKLLTAREQKQWLYYSNPKMWESLGKYQRNRALKTWGNLLRKYGQPPNLLPLVLDTWERLFSTAFEAEKPQPSYQHNLEMEAHETATFLPLECTVKKLRNTIEKPISPIASSGNKKNYNITHNNDLEKVPLKRCCLSCGKDISQQSPRAIFCSENIYGKAAKQCRNAHSNKRRDKKRIIQKAMTTDYYLVITYTDENGNAYTDTLHPTELNVSKEWLDRIQNIFLQP